MFEVLSRTLLAGLSLWNSKEANKYRDKEMELRTAYYNEYNKSPELRSDAVLDNIYFELCNLAAGFSAAVRESNIKNQS